MTPLTWSLPRETSSVGWDWHAMCLADDTATTDAQRAATDLRAESLRERMRRTPMCNVNWRSHGCSLELGHAGECVCEYGCSDRPTPGDTLYET